MKFLFDKQTTLYEWKMSHRPVKVITEHIVYFVKYRMKWDNHFIEYISLMGENGMFAFFAQVKGQNAHLGLKSSWLYSYYIGTVEL